jgi:hypothetical protein
MTGCIDRKIGKVIRVPLRALEEWIEKNTTA